jgi:hypothetical protein
MFEQFPAFAAYRRSRWFRRSLWAGAVFLLYLVVGFFVVPPILKAQLLQRLPPLTQRHVAIQKVRFNPLVLSLTIGGVSLTEPDGQVFASWDELYVNFQLSSLVRLAWTFDELSLKNPYGHLIMKRDGGFNFSNMGGTNAPPATPRKEEKSHGLPAINVAKLRIDGGDVVWEDETHLMPLRVEIKPINFSLTNLTTRFGKGSEYGFEAGTDSGKRIAWFGSLVAQPFQSRGHIELAGIEARKWTAYLRDHLRAQVTEGRVNVAADYDLRSGTNGFGVVVRNGAVSLAGFVVKDAEASEVVTTLPLLSVDGLDFDLLGRTLRAANVKIDGWSKAIRIEKDGTLNLNLLLDPREDAAPSTNRAPVAGPVPKEASLPWVFAVDNFLLTNGTMAFADLTRREGFATKLSPIEIRVRQFSTKPGSDARYDFKIPTETAETVSGAGTFSVVPLRSEGSVRVASVEIKKYAPYYAGFMRGEVAGGHISVGADYRFAAGSNAPSLSVSNAAFELTEFQLRADGESNALVSIPSFGVSNGEADLEKQSLRVGSVKSADAALALRRNKDGALNLAALFAVPAAPASSPTTTVAPPAETSPPAAHAPWSVLVKDIALDNYAVRFADEQLAQPSSLGIDQIRLHVKDLTLSSNEPLTLALSARLNDAGELRVDGTATANPPAADLVISLAGVDLRPLQPYLNESVRLAIRSGALNLRSHARYDVAEAAKPRVKFTGDLELTNFATADLARSDSFVKWDSLGLKGIDFDLNPNRLQISEIKWRGLDTSLVIGADHRANLQNVFPAKATNAAPPAAAAQAPASESASSPKAEFPLQVGALTLEQCALHFRDESIEPACAFDVADFGGSIKGLSSSPAGNAAVDIQGKVSAGAPFGISGTINPLGRDLALDLTVSFTNTDLTGFSTYLEKYAGYPLNRGKLSMELRYGIREKQLQAQNAFRLDHFTLGARNDSTNATHLPVKLAVALLKDTAGRINLDVPVSGRTDDPQFRVAPILLKTVMNLMVKAATSPFSLLGSLVGGGEELSFVEFPAGSAEIPDTEHQKLEKLVSALRQRPALTLEIAGSFDPQNDRPALARLKLERELKTLRARELAGSGRAATNFNEIELSPAQRERLLAQALADLSAGGTPATPAAAQPAGSQQTEAAPAARSVSNIPPAVVSSRHWPDASRAQTKGAWLLLPGSELTASRAVKAAPPAPGPQAAPTAGATNDVAKGSVELEAHVLNSIVISGEEERDLAKRRAEAVQAEILKTGAIARDRLLTLTPKPGAAAGKGASRVNLSLD